MLVLSRGEGESIRIGDDVEILILESRHGGRVRIGIKAPRDVPVHREEVYQAIAAQKRGGDAA